LSLYFYSDFFSYSRVYYIPKNLKYEIFGDIDKIVLNILTFLLEKIGQGFTQELFPYLTGTATVASEEEIPTGAFFYPYPTSPLARGRGGGGRISTICLYFIFCPLKLE